MQFNVNAFSEYKYNVAILRSVPPHAIYRPVLCRLICFEREGIRQTEFAQCETTITSEKADKVLSIITSTYSAFNI